MLFQKFLLPLGCVALLLGAFHFYAWPGLALAGGALVMWLLLHFSRLLQVLKRASARPIGYVDSAVMLNAKLRPDVTLLHVVAMTRALGELTSQKDTQPELYRWRDGSLSQVICEFRGGRLKKWHLERPSVAEP